MGQPGPGSVDASSTTAGRRSCSARPARLVVLDELDIEGTDLFDRDPVHLVHLSAKEGDEGLIGELDHELVDGPPPLAPHDVHSDDIGAHGTDPAWSAFPTRLEGAELHRKTRHNRHIGSIIKYDKTTVAN